MDINKQYRTNSNHFFLVRHSQSLNIPDCPTGTATLWTGYSLYSFTYDNDVIITQDLGTIDSCVQLINQAYFSYCSGTSDCNVISTALWLSSHNTSISRCSVCHVFSSPITLHSQSTIPPPCPSNWNSLWEGYSHIQVSEFIRIQQVLVLNSQNSMGKPGEGLSSTGSCLEHFLKAPVVRCPVEGSCEIDSEKLWLSVANSSRTITANQISRCTVCIL